MRGQILSAAVAWMAVCAVGVSSATDPIPASPRIVASPTSVQPVIPAGTPVPLDVGKFLWLELKTMKNGIMVPYEGKVKFDFSKPGFVKLYPSPPKGSVAADSYPGIKQDDTEPDWHKKPSTIAVPCLGVKGGDVTISAWGIVDEEPAKIAELMIRVRGPPDEKKDDEKKDDEKPIGTNPFGNQFGLHVLITFDGTEPESQKSIIYGLKVREYLNAKCAIGPNGKTRTYRIWPTVVDAGNEAKVWTDAFAKTSGKRRVLIGNGVNGYDGEMPANADEMIKLLQKFGG